MGYGLMNRITQLEFAKLPTLIVATQVLPWRCNYSLNKHITNSQLDLLRFEWAFPTLERL